MGCGNEISVLLALQDALASSASQRLPQNNGLWQHSSSTGPGIKTNRESDRPRSRPQFLVALSFRQLAKPGRRERPFDYTTQHLLYLLHVDALLPPVCLFHGAAAVSVCVCQAAANCDSLCAHGMTMTQTSAADARKMHRKRIQCISTWRSTHLGRMYDGGAPGLASERLSRAGTKCSAYCTMPAQMHTCPRQYGILPNFRQTITIAAANDYTFGANTSQTE